MRTLYDGIRADAAAIAAKFPHADLVAGYVNGRYAWTPGDWSLFPHAGHVTISVTAAANAGDVLDVEQGDARPDEAPGWIRMRKASGLYRPTVYCARSAIPSVRRATGNLILGKDYDIWCADWTGSPHQVTAPGQPPAACAATQYADGSDHDSSAVYDDGWPHRVPPSGPGEWYYAAPGHLAAEGGHTNFHAAWTLPAGALTAPDHYMVWVYKGAACSRATLVASYPRREGGTSTSPDPGGLERGTLYTVHVAAFGPGGSHAKPGTFASATFRTG